MIDQENLNITIEQDDISVSLSQELLNITVEDTVYLNQTIDTENLSVQVDEVFYVNSGSNPDALDSTYICGQHLSGNRMVYVMANHVYYADINNIDCAGKVLGMTTHAALAGQSIRIRRSGKVQNQGWGLTPESTYHLGADGAISQTIGNGVFSQIVGFAVSPDTMQINIYNPILR